MIPNISKTPTKQIQVDIIVQLAQSFPFSFYPSVSYFMKSLLYSLTTVGSIFNLEANSLPELFNIFIFSGIQYSFRKNDVIRKFRCFS